MQLLATRQMREDKKRKKERKKEKIGAELGNKKNIGNDTITLGWPTHSLIGDCLNC